LPCLTNTHQDDGTYIRSTIEKAQPVQYFVGISGTGL
jgi:hypothetical protein